MTEDEIAETCEAIADNLTAPVAFFDSEGDIAPLYDLARWLDEIMSNGVVPDEEEVVSLAGQIADHEAFRASEIESAFEESDQLVREAMDTVHMLPDSPDDVSREARRIYRAKRPMSASKVIGSFDDVIEILERHVMSMQDILDKLLSIIESKVVEPCEYISGSFFDVSDNPDENIDIVFDIRGDGEWQAFVGGDILAAINEANELYRSLEGRVEELQDEMWKASE